MIRRARFACALTLTTAGLLALAAPPAAADAAVDVAATFADGRPAFVSDGAVNPLFTFAPGDAVTITVTFDGFHNFRVAEPLNEETSRRSSGTETLSFTIPEDFTGDVAYVCDVHPSTMRGTVRVTAGEGAGEEDANATQDAPEEHVEDATHVRFTATRDDEGFAFTTPDGARNPTLRFDPGEDVLVQLTVDGTHNLRVDTPVDARTDVQSGGNTTLRFTIPEDFTGTIAYWCEPHRGAGMTGVIEVGGVSADEEGDAGTDGGAGTDTGSGADEDAGAPPPDADARTPAPGTVAGAVALALAAGARRAWRVTRP